MASVTPICRALLRIVPARRDGSRIVCRSQIMRLIYFIFANALEVFIFAIGAAMICAVSAIL